MFPTVELRWFLPGRVPAEVNAWFAQAGSGLGPALHRVDHYLRLPGQGALGIKLREGRLEVKERQGDGQVVQLQGVVAGRLERWRKFSFGPTEGSGDLTRRLSASDSWVAVEKARLLRRYQVTGAGSVVPIRPVEYPDRACDWELTELCIEDNTWWTVAFEASGQEPLLEQTLHIVVATILAEGAPPMLGAQVSFGYPHWLALPGQTRP